MHKNQKYDWSNKEKFIQDLEKSTSISDFLINNGLTSGSGNSNTLKKWAHIHLIDLNKFNYQQVNFVKKPRKRKQNYSYEKIFCTESYCDKKTLKKILIKENLIAYKCSCGLEEFWQGKPITLQLEHKNGDNFDNRLENLEFLCPNCHSQTLTYGSKNRHLRNFSKRLELLKGYNEICLDNIEEICKIFKLNKEVFYNWAVLYSDKLKNAGIIVSLLKNRRGIKAVKVQNILNEIKLNNFTEKNINEITEKHNVKSRHIKIILKENNPNLFNDLIAIPSNKETEKKFFRLQQLSIITNKKQVPTLAKSWNVSSTGAKKWIKNNAPKKFTEIYDDAFLEKNKISALKAQKLDYIKNLTIENFNLNNFIKSYGGNKSGAYSLLSKYNKDLFAHISKTPDCIYCNSKTRTSGTTVKSGETVQRYRCVDCNKSFS